MAAQTDAPTQPSQPHDGRKFNSIFRKFFGKDQAAVTPANAQPASPPPSRPNSPAAALIRRVSRKVVPGLPRAKTFKRQQSEDRDRLEATETTQAERRAVSVDRRLRSHRSNRSLSPTGRGLPGTSAPDFLDTVQSPRQSHAFASQQPLSAPPSPVDAEHALQLKGSAPAVSHGIQDEEEMQGPVYSGAPSTADAQSMTTSAYDNLIKDELETKWILNLSMHFRDKSKREKFFVTYHERTETWRRVTISLDYRDAPDDSLEKDLSMTRYQRDKSAKIYEAIRESLQDIQFYDTVTNLKLQTTDGRLHVHVVEDVNEIIHYPTYQNVRHLHCRLVHERELEFDSHMSGFVYKVRHDHKVLIKKEIPGPDTVDEFLYEVNALNSLRFSSSIIDFYGVVVDDAGHVKGLLIDFAERGALVDVIYEVAEQGSTIDWPLKARWARQIVQGLSDVHEAGFVQGDFTLSNIVIDEDQNAKIIDINRRGCPVGWEPPEATPLIDCNQRISMYIGVKSDLFQLGMVLWALATMEDEPEAHRRPLRIDHDMDVPKWYRNIVNTCLHEIPRCRMQASELLSMFPEEAKTISVEDDYAVRSYQVADYDDGEHPHIRTDERPYTWTSNPYSYNYPESPAFSEEPYYPPRGRSPPRPLPSKYGIYDAPYLGRPFIGRADSEEEQSDDEAEMSQETPTMEKITKQLEHRLSIIEAKLPHEPGNGPALTTGGESQKEEVMTSLADHLASHELKAKPNPNDTLVSPKPASPPEAALHDQPSLERSGGTEHEIGSRKSLNLNETPPSNLETTGARRDDATTADDALRTSLAGVLPMAEDAEVRDNYVLGGSPGKWQDSFVSSGRKEDNAVADLRPKRQVRGGLVGVGSGLEGSCFRSPRLSDDDLSSVDGGCDVRDGSPERSFS